MTRWRRSVAVLFAALGFAVASLPGAALACPVCFSAKDEANRIAFFLSTVFLTLLPLLLIGGCIVWVARRARELDGESSTELGPRQAAPGGDASPGGALPAPSRR